MQRRGAEETDEPKLQWLAHEPVPSCALRRQQQGIVPILDVTVRPWIVGDEMLCVVVTMAVSLPRRPEWSPLHGMRHMSSCSRCTGAPAAGYGFPAPSPGLWRAGGQQVCGYGRTDAATGLYGWRSTPPVVAPSSWRCAGDRSHAPVP